MYARYIAALPPNKQQYSTYTSKVAHAIMTGVERKILHHRIYNNYAMFCRQVGTIAYRSGPEWEQRFGQRRRDPDTVPDFCQDFEIEHYLLRQVERELILFGTLRN